MIRMQQREATLDRNQDLKIMEWICRLPASDCNYVLGKVVPLWAVKDPDAVTQWACGLQDKGRRSRVLAMLRNLT